MDKEIKESCEIFGKAYDDFKEWVNSDEAQINENIKGKEIKMKATSCIMELINSLKEECENILIFSKEGVSNTDYEKIKQKLNHICHDMETVCYNFEQEKLKYIGIEDVLVLNNAKKVLNFTKTFCVALKTSLKSCMVAKDMTNSSNPLSIVQVYNTNAEENDQNESDGSENEDHLSYESISEETEMIQSNSLPINQHFDTTIKLDSGQLEPAESTKTQAFHDTHNQLDFKTVYRRSLVVDNVENHVINICEGDILESKMYANVKRQLQIVNLEDYAMNMLKLCFFCKHYKFNDKNNNFAEIFEKVLLFITCNKNYFKNDISLCMVYQPFDEELQSERKEKWEKLMKFLENPNNCSDDYDRLSKDSFSNFLLLLIDKNYYKEVFDFANAEIKNNNKRKRSICSFAKFFLCVILDLRDYRGCLNRETPHVDIDIIELPINNDEIFDNDIIYILSSNDSQDKCIVNDKLDEDYEKSIRERLIKNKNIVGIQFTSVRIKENIFWICFFSLLSSIMSVMDIGSDLYLIYEFWNEGQIYYVIWTMVVLVLSGMVKILLNKFLLKKYDFLNKFSFPILNNKIFTYVLDFLQLSTFFKNVSVIKLHWQRIKHLQNYDRLSMLMDNIYVGHPEYIDHSMTRMNFVEMFFECMPQTILQLYIIGIEKKTSTKQIFSILTAVCAMIFSTLKFISLHTGIKYVNFYKRPLNFVVLLCLLRDTSYIVFTLLFITLLFCELQSYIVITWIIFHIIISYGSTNEKGHTEEQDFLICFGFKLKFVPYWTIFNYITVTEITCCIGYLSWIYIDGRHQVTNQFFIRVFTSALTFFLIWSTLCIFNNFNYPYNLMYMPWHIRNSVYYPAKELFRAPKLKMKAKK